MNQESREERKQTDTKQRSRGRQADRPSPFTMITAAAAAAASFFVITKSGIAGTLMGAAVFSAVYSGASHWLGHAVERGASWWLERRGVEVNEPEQDESELANEPEPEPSAERRLVSSPGFLRARRITLTWAPLALAVAAVAASGYSMATGTPIERVIIRERVVEKPVVEERVVVERETVTVTVPVPGSGGSGSGTATPTTTTTTTTLDPAPTDTTTTTTVGTPTSSTTTVTTPPLPTTTTAPPPAG
jgi:hypothetical protein